MGPGDMFPVPVPLHLHSRNFIKGDLHVPVYFLAMLVVKLGSLSPPGVSGNARAQLTGEGVGCLGEGAYDNMIYASSPCLLFNDKFNISSSIHTSFLFFIHLMHTLQEVRVSAHKFRWSSLMIHQIERSFAMWRALFVKAIFSLYWFVLITFISLQGCRTAFFCPSGLWP